MSFCSEESDNQNWDYFVSLLSMRAGESIREILTDTYKSVFNNVSKIALYIIQEAQN